MLERVLIEMINYFGTDVRRINHALKVYGFASAICRNEGFPDDQILITEISGILHDIGIPESEKKYGSCSGKFQEIEGPPVARDILERIGISVHVIERVLFIIGNHHTYTKIDGNDFQALVEADFLVNIDEDNMTASASAISEKYFKTKTGKNILNTLYYT
jgi:HD superfamily phosphodiesterase